MTGLKDVSARDCTIICKTNLITQFVVAVDIFQKFCWHSYLATVAKEAKCARGLV